MFKKHPTAEQFSRRAFAVREVAAADREPTEAELADDLFMREARHRSLRLVMAEEQRRGGRGGRR